MNKTTIIHFQADLLKNHFGYSSVYMQLSIQGILCLVTMHYSLFSNNYASILYVVNHTNNILRLHIYNIKHLFLTRVLVPGKILIQ